MQTIKTAVVVVLLLAVLYGAYVALNGADTPLPAGLEEMASNLDIDFDGGLNPGPFASSPPANAAASSTPPPMFNGLPSSPPSLQNSSPLSGQTQPTNSIAALPPMPSMVNTTPSSSLPPLPPLAPPTSLLATPSVDTKPMTDLNKANFQASPFESKNIPNSNLTSTPKTSTSTLENSSSGLPNLPSQLTGSFTSPDLGNRSNLVSTSSGTSDPASTAAANLATKAADVETEKSLPTTSSKSFENARKVAMEQIGRGELKDALATLSLFYNAPELTSQQFSELIDILDPLCAEVVYSRRHLLDLPHVVVQGETLDQIAQIYDIPADILGKVNAIENPNAIPPETKLKVIPGPFRAEVDMTRSEMTLFLGELYAGRFAISLGEDPQPREGVFQIVEKQKDRNYYGKGGTQIPGSDPRNPFGGWWMDLGQDLSIHGSPSQTSGSSEKMGCISLSPIDARDVFGMLSRGSKVQIRR